MSVTDIENASPDTGRAAAAKPSPKADGLAQNSKIAAAKARQALQAGARRGATAARTQAAAAGRKLTQVTQERPLASVSTALGVGLAVGLVAGVCATRSLGVRARGF